MKDAKDTPAGCRNTRFCAKAQSPRDMQTRELGDTGHESSLMTFGAIALNWLEQEGADQMVELVLDRRCPRRPRRWT